MFVVVFTIKLYSKLMYYFPMKHSLPTTHVLVRQAFGVVQFLFHYAMPVCVFTFCYASIFHTIRRQSKVVGGHMRHGHDVTMTTTTRDPNAGQVQQQVTAATTGDRLSRTELNVLKTMIAVIICFTICWSVPAFANLLDFLGVSIISRQL